MVYGIDHFHYHLTRTHHLCLSIERDYGQLALHQHPVIHDQMMMPIQLLTRWDNILNCHQFRLSLWIVRQVRTVPTLTGAQQLNTLGFAIGGALFLEARHEQHHEAHKREQYLQ